MPDAHLPYIDHLSVDQLRRRAAYDRADALAMVDQVSAGTVSMLLEDAERCEARATMLEQRCGGSIAAGLGGLTIETALTQLVQAARGRMVGDQPGRPASPITAIHAVIRRHMDRGTAYAFVAHCADSTWCRLQSAPQPTLEAAYVAAVRSLVSLTVRGR
ncbi:hypothetical protein GBZ48_22055 [Azospirillum melinis]|uniref:Uncharacterized protein n=1 Tax=Azospirillum melinis TaxID=328839 RepID=A0ABX2KEB5_9PROT|nr:hypothetical protein [Azospirillum melinis]MBP2307492.1 hypothetical protein [Azospirillum melinis]NUB01937.1 hypothetical protein [Azospirillum melinis]